MATGVDPSGGYGLAPFPMSSVDRPPTSVFQKMEDMNKGIGSAVDFQEKLRVKRQMDADRQVLDTAARSGRYDLTKPEGYEGILKDYGQALSADTQGRISEHVMKTRQTLTEYANALTKLDKDKLEMVKAHENELYPQFGGLINNYEKFYQENLQTKGSQEAKRLAEEQFGQQRSELLGRLGQEKNPDGTPRFNPGAVQRFSQMPYDEFKNNFESSPAKRTMLEEALKERQIALDRARESALTDPKNWDVYQAPDGSMVKVNAKTGDMRDMNDQPISRPMAGLVPIKSNRQRQYQSGVGKIIGDMEQMKAAGKLTPEIEKAMWASAEKLSGVGKDLYSQLTDDERQWLAEFTANGGRVPSLPLGSGSAPAAMRLQFLRDFIDVAKGHNNEVPGSDAAMIQYQREAARRSLSVLRTQSAQIDAAGESAARAMDNALAEVRKLGGPDSPLLRKYWNRAYTDIAGERDFQKLNTYMVEVREAMSRVMANSSGAGAPPVKYLTLVEGITNNNMPLGQMLDGVDAMKQLIQNRKDGVKAVSNNITDGIKFTTTGTVTPGAGGRPDPVESDDPVVIRAGYDTLKGFIQSPDAKPESIVANRREINRLRARYKNLTGQELPEVPDPRTTKPPAPSPIRTKKADSLRIWGPGMAASQPAPTGIPVPPQPQGRW